MCVFCFIPPVWSSHVPIRDPTFRRYSKDVGKEVVIKRGDYIVVVIEFFKSDMY